MTIETSTEYNNGTVKEGIPAFRVMTKHLPGPWADTPEAAKEEFIKAYEDAPRPFQYISRANIARCRMWHPNGVQEWTISDWAVAMAGEAGEACNAVKKLRRIETGARQFNGPKSHPEAVQAIAIELGDTFLYLDILAWRLGVDLERAIIDTFNRVSIREGFPQRL